MSANPQSDAPTAPETGGLGLPRAVWAATLVAGSLRAWYVLLAHPPAKYLYSDMLTNVLRAYAVLDPRHVPNAWDTFVPRGIVEICAAALRLFPNRSVEALTPVQALLSTACVPLAYVGLRRFFGRRPAAIAAWLLALDYLAIGYAGYFLAENYLTFFLTLALALLRPEKPGSCFLSGLSLGLGAWFKAQAFTLLPLWALALWWAGRPSAPDPKPRRTAALALAAGCLLWVVPESVLVSRIAHRPLFMSSNGGQNFYSGHCPIHLATCTGSWGVYAGGLPKVYQRDEGWPDVAFSAPFYDSPFYLKQGLVCIRQSGWRFGLWLVQQIGDTFAGWPGSTIDVWPDWATEQKPWARGTNLAVAYLFAPLAFLGLWRERRRLGAWLGFGLPMASVLGVAVIFLGDPRFRQPYDVFLFGSAATVLAGAAEAAWLARLQGRLRLAARPLAAPARFASRHAVALAATAAAAAGALFGWPLWRGAWFDSHEGNRDLWRLVELFRAFRSGQVWPRWAPDFFGGHGSPYFDLHPPGFLAAAALPHLLGLGLAPALEATALAFAILGGLGAFCYARGETGRDDAGLVGALAFTFAPYRFVDLFMRGALAEHAAFALVPWLLFLVRELGRCPRARRGRLALLAALCGGALPLLSPVLGLLALALGALHAAGPAFADWRARRRPSALPALALLGALGLAAVALLPWARDLARVQVQRGITGYFDASGHTVPFQDFFRLGAYAFGADLPSQNARMPFSLGWPVGLGLLILLAALPWPRLRRRLAATSGRWWAALFALCALMGPLAAPLWSHVGLFRLLQFPWRLLGFAAALGAVATAVTFAAATESVALARWRWPLALAFCAFALLVSQPMEAVTGYVAPDAASLSPEGIARTLDDTGSASEDLPAKVAGPPTKVRGKLAVAASPAVTVGPSTQPGPTRYRIEATARAPGAVDVLVYAFPGWRARTVEGPAEAALETSPAGFLRLALPAAGRYTVEVAFGTTPLRRAAAAISLLTLLLYLPLLRLLASRRERTAAPAVDARDSLAA